MKSYEQNVAIRAFGVVTKALKEMIYDVLGRFFVNKDPRKNKFAEIKC